MIPYQLLLLIGTGDAFAGVTAPAAQWWPPTAERTEINEARSIEIAQLRTIESRESRIIEARETR